MERKKINQMTEFLTFGYFGYTSDEVAAMCPCRQIRLCAERAYRDWNRTTAFEDSATEKDKESFLTICRGILVQGILGILEKKELHSDSYNGKQELFDKLHSEICEKIEEVANNQKIGPYQDKWLLKEKGGQRFYYGQAQKWLNMTLKYMDLLDISNVRKIRNLLHVPIDRYILRAAASPKPKKPRYESEYSLFKNIAPKRHTGREKSEGKIYYSDERAQPWSQLNQRDYIELQKDLRSAIKSATEIESNNWKHVTCPMDWEARAWIEQAKLERGKL